MGTILDGRCHQRTRVDKNEKTDMSSSNTNDNNHNRFTNFEEDDEEDKEISEASVSTSVAWDAINNRNASEGKVRHEEEDGEEKN